MTVLDVSIVNVALPSIGTALSFSRDSLQWVITAYSITFGGFLLLGGRAADLLGRRRMFLAGVILFTAASFLCGLAWSEGVLVAARALQGLGAALISPAALSKATDHGWASGWTLLRLAIAAVLLVAFLAVESRVKDPLMPFKIFRVRTLAGANVAGLLLGVALFANFFILTLYVQQVLGWT